MVMHHARLPKIFQPHSSNDLIRLGKDNDGGYIVVKEDVEKTERLICFGVGQDWSFEVDFLKINNCPIDAYDANSTIDSKHVSFFKDSVKQIRQNVSKNNIETILKECNNVFLKCDIEGCEYEILDSLIRNTNKFTGIVIEFHDIGKHDNFDNLLNFIGKMNQRLVHLHVNNYFYYKAPDRNIPDIFEISLTSSNNIVYDPEKTLPIDLDMPNNPNDEQFYLTF